MKVTFLGTGAAWPSARHNNVCFVVHSREPVLFECGPSILYQLAVAGIDPGELRTVIISHIHGDHALGLPMLLVSAQIANRRNPLTVCAPESTVEPLRRICTTVYPSLGRLLASLVDWRPLPEKGSATLALPSLSITTARASHSVPVVSTHAAFAHASLAFSGDTAFCQDVADNAAGTNLLIHESNWSLTLKTPTGHGHSTAAEAGQVAALAKAKRLALVHTSRELAGHEQELETEAAAHFPAGEVFAPADSQTIDL
ncbi:MAG TPA: ribonuclease Z [Chloroflexota bacterium]|nr:ribonuclease Z [Chloroflexota bacterium]